jgi:enolase-phosphatase E1
LKAWRAQGRAVAIYSSGSVFAQKLLMRHVKGEEGTEDLEGLVSGGWFDTVNAGMKAERGSYERIAMELKVSSTFFLGVLECGLVLTFL